MRRFTVVNAPAISRAGLYLMMQTVRHNALQQISFAADDWRFINLFSLCSANWDKQVRSVEFVISRLPIKGKTCVSRLLSTYRCVIVSIVYYWHASVVQYVKREL